MEQKSEVRFRAEKEYKNSREKFYLLLREVISNSIHAVLIRKSKENNFKTPHLDLSIVFNGDSCKIVLRDNGEGFTKNNQECFEELDRRNRDKMKMHFHPLGQGRLAIVYFADTAIYETVYKDDNGTYWKREILYPDTSAGLFDFEKIPAEETEQQNSYTNLTLTIENKANYSRAKTFFSKVDNLDKLKLWISETFFPFFIQNQDLTINLWYNGKDAIINRDKIEAETISKPFEILCSDNSKYPFTLWLIKNESILSGENPIICFARNLKAELSKGKLSYVIDSDRGYTLYLTSDYFDNYVDSKGETIEISPEDIAKISGQINDILNEEFKSIIQQNQTQSFENFRSFQSQYPSLEVFVNSDKISNENVIVSETEILRRAIEEKSRIEKKFWTHIDKDPQTDDDVRFDDSEECHKLLNSSLHIYVRHRKSVLKRLYELLPKFTEDGEYKPELESTVHELFLKRGNIINRGSNINHLHNLWIIDDKFTTFSNHFWAQSTKPGQSLSDIYIGADDPDKAKQILILELKSTTKAHNAGSRVEGMIAQVKRYAQDFYKNPEKHLNWRARTDQVQYTGIIIARSSDINKELTSPACSGGYKPIPFLENSYYFDDDFRIDNNPRLTLPIRIELYSFEDIYELASSRNEVFFKLLEGEFKFDNRKAK